MKKLLSLICLLAMLCTLASPIKATTHDNQEMPDAGWSEHAPFDDKITSEISPIAVAFFDYIHNSMGIVSGTEEWTNIIVELWGRELIDDFEVRKWTSRTADIMAFTNIFSMMVKFNIPDAVFVGGVEKHNDWKNEVSQPHLIFTQADIDALLSRDPVIVTAQFARQTAIVIGDRAFSPYWLYMHTPAQWHEAGITPEMVTAKLEIYARIPFTDEAVAFFEANLSYFLGFDVVFSEIRGDEPEPPPETTPPPVDTTPTPTPTTPPTDNNPPTGATLAVIPVVSAALAVFVMKKRK